MSTLTEKLCAMAADCAVIGKDAENVGQKYDYVSAEAVLTRVNASRVKHGVAVVQTQVTERFERVQKVGKDGTPQEQTLAIVHVRMMLSDGSMEKDADGNEKPAVVVFEGVGSGMDSGDKAIMKATTAAHKYAWALLLGISWGDDPENDQPPQRAPKAPQKVAEKEAPTDTVDGLVSLIEKTATVAELEALKPRALALRSDPRYTEIRTAYKAHEQKVLNGSTGV